MDSLGKYRIDGLIAEGGMARIFRAKTEGVGGVEKVVALKCLKETMSADGNFINMMRDEARITVRMTHKNIGQVFGFEQYGNTYFMVMEYVDGINLSDLCKYLFGLNRVFPIEAAVFIAMEICSGLSYAHRMTDDAGNPLNIVHRDVNPQNVCISKEGEVKLIDFGIAKAQTISSETQVGTIKGKFNYMSPEQARGERVDQRTDVFALGAILYELLCGHMLYPLSLDDARLRTKTRMADFVPIESYMPDIPPKLLMILNKALTRDINQRFASSRDFLLALSQFFHDSCKIYDSLNLSMLVEKCIENRHNKGDLSDIHAMRAAQQQANGQGRRSVHNQQVIAQGRNGIDNDSEFSMESSETAVLSAEEAKKIADISATDDSKTSIYQKPIFSDMPSGLLSRSIDLSIEKPSASQETVMVKLTPPPGNNSFTQSLYNRIISMNEKTLIIVAVALTVMLILTIIVFVTLDSGEESFPQPADDVPAASSD